MFLVLKVENDKCLREDEKEYLIEVLDCFESGPAISYDSQHNHIDFVFDAGSRKKNKKKDKQ